MLFNPKLRKLFKEFKRLYRYGTVATDKQVLHGYHTRIRSYCHYGQLTTYLDPAQFSGSFVVEECTWDLESLRVTEYQMVKLADEIHCYLQGRLS